MSITALITGKLNNDPEIKTAKSGREYARFRIAAHDGEQTILISCLAFSDTAVDAVCRLAKGDQLAVTGKAKPTAWQGRDGLALGLEVIADQVMSLYAATKKRGKQAATTTEPRNDAGEYQHTTGSQQAPHDDEAWRDEGLADDLPWR